MSTLNENKAFVCVCVYAHVCVLRACVHVCVYILNSFDNLEADHIFNHIVSGSS